MGGGRAWGAEKTGPQFVALAGGHNKFPRDVAAGGGSWPGAVRLLKAGDLPEKRRPGMGGVGLVFRALLSAFLSGGAG